MSLALAPPCSVVGQGRGYRELSADAWGYEGGLKNNQKHQLQTTRAQGDHKVDHMERPQGEPLGRPPKKTSPGPVLESIFVDSFLTNEAPACAFFTLMVKSSQEGEPACPVVNVGFLVRSGAVQHLPLRASSRWFACWRQKGDFSTRTS